MKILLSAYACEPGRGSEPDIGFQTMLNLAEHHDVWVLTRQNNLPILRSVLSDDARASRIHLNGIDLNDRALRIKRASHIGLTWYYHRWQGEAARVALELERAENFDAVFHITFASYWMKVGAIAVKKPFLWGPIGGGVETPIRLISELGLVGCLEETARSAGRRLLFRVPSIRRAAQRADFIFVNNRDTKKRIQSATSATIKVLPNPTAVRVPELLASRVPTKDIAFVARLIPWKGLKLGLRAMRYVQTSQARLVVFGDGSDRKRIERLVQRWRLGERVLLAGHVPRDDLLNQLSRCGAMIHPALHEEGGNVVAESLAMGVPVVCLDRGGPPITLSLFPMVESAAIAPGWPIPTARAMAQALDRFLSSATSREGEAFRPHLNFNLEILAALNSIVRHD